MRRVVALGLLAASLGAAPPEFLDAKQQAAFLDKVSEAMAGLNSFVAEFDQEKQLKIFEKKVKSTGLILFTRPDRLRWEIREPFRSILIVSGDDVAKFEWVGGKRRALKLGRSRDAIMIAMDRIRSWFRGEFGKAGKEYEVKVTAGKNPKILLRPRDEKLRRNLREIEFLPTADLKAMRKVTIRERAGDETQMTFRDHVQNVTPGKRAYSLTDPEEIDPRKLRDGG